MKEDLTACHIIFKGRVQGVGFRFTACEIAKLHNLSGFVRNLFNGNVEVKIEGKRSTIEDFLKELRREMKFYISDLEISWGEYQGQFKNFEIRF